MRVIFLVAAVFIFGGCTKSESLNTLGVELKANIKGLDPAQSNDLYVSNVLSVTYESLYQYSYLKRPYEVEPLLAEGMPEVSKDGLTYKIKIKKGIKFQDSDIFPGGKGRELKAQDFVYQWKRLADPEVLSEGFFVFDGKVKGINDWKDKKAKKLASYETPIEGFVIPDDYTIEIHLTRPYYQLVYQLTTPYTAAVPHEIVDKYGKEMVNHMVGTGPYVLKEWVRNSKLVFEKNPTYHDDKYPSSGSPGDESAGLLKDAGQRLPFSDRIVFYELNEDQPRWLRFLKGDTEFCEIPKDNFDSSVKDKKLLPEYAAKGIRLSIETDPDLTYTGFNMMDPILGKKDLVRKAMALAEDIPTLIEKFYNGRAINAQSPITPTIDPYDASFVNPYKQSNLAKAKELLKEAGHPDGKGLPEFEYSLPNGTTYRQMGEFFQQNMARIGIKVRIAMTSWPQFTEKLKTKKAQIYGIAWAADYPDAENFLQLLYGKNISPGPNNSNYQSKEFDELYEKASLLPPGEERNQIYKKMRDVFVKDMPWIPEVHRLRYQLYHGWLNNFKTSLTILNPYKYMRIDAEKKKQLKATL